MNHEVAAVVAPLMTAPAAKLTRPLHIIITKMSAYQSVQMGFMKTMQPKNVLNAILPEPNVTGHPPQNVQNAIQLTVTY